MRDQGRVLLPMYLLYLGVGRRFGSGIVAKVVPRARRGLSAQKGLFPAEVRRRRATDVGGEVLGEYFGRCLVPVLL